MTTQQLYNRLSFAVCVHGHVYSTWEWRGKEIKVKSTNASAYDRIQRTDLPERAIHAGYTLKQALEALKPCKS
jgi:hypothetical protein